MHPRNPYASTPPDFAALCRKDAQLAELVGWPSSTASASTPSIDFTDAAVVRRVTEATLEHDFGVFVRLRDDRLCPPVPNRLNYVVWVGELLDACYFNELAAYMNDEPSQLHAEEGDHNDNGPRKRLKTFSDDAVQQQATQRILDVGTGSSCIYPVLGRALYPNWEFIATEVDEDSFQHVRGILSDTRNNDAKIAHPARHNPHRRTDALALLTTVHLLHRTPDQSLLLEEKTIRETAKLPPLPCSAMGQHKDSAVLYHASMCNPPFYSSAQDMQASLDGKAAPPNAVQHGAAVEMVYERGGEVAFVTRMIDESVALARQVTWFTSMLGKLSSIAPLIEKLKQRDNDNFYVTEFVQGHTKRWALAWTFSPFRVPLPLVSVSSALLALQPSAGRHSFAVGDRDPDVMSYVRQALEQRAFRTTVSNDNDGNESLIAYVAHDTWSRKARRKQQQSQSQAAGARDSDAQVRSVPALGVRISRIQSVSDTETTPSDTIARLQALWIFGHSRQLFDSFVMSVLGPLNANRQVSKPSVDQ